MRELVGEAKEGGIVQHALAGGALLNLDGQGGIHARVLGVDCLDSGAELFEALLEKGGVLEIALGRVDHVYGVEVDAEVVAVDRGDEAQVLVGRTREDPGHGLKGEASAYRGDRVDDFPCLGHDPLKCCFGEVVGVGAIPSISACSGDVYRAGGADLLGQGEGGFAAVQSFARFGGVSVEGVAPGTDFGDEEIGGFGGPPVLGDGCVVGIEADRAIGGSISFGLDGGGPLGRVVEVSVDRSAEADHSPSLRHLARRSGVIPHNNFCDDGSNSNASRGDFGIWDGGLGCLPDDPRQPRLDLAEDWL